MDSQIRIRRKFYLNKLHHEVRSLTIIPALVRGAHELDLGAVNDREAHNIIITHPKNIFITESSHLI